MGKPELKLEGEIWVCFGCAIISLQDRPPARGAIVGGGAVALGSVAAVSAVGAVAVGATVKTCTKTSAAFVAVGKTATAAGRCRCRSQSFVGCSSGWEGRLWPLVASGVTTVYYAALVAATGVVVGGWVGLVALPITRRLADARDPTLYVSGFMLKSGSFFRSRKATSGEEEDVVDGCLHLWPRGT